MSELGISFVLPGYSGIELKPNGADILLNEDNVEEYLRLFTQTMFKTTVGPQVAAFREGFNHVFDVKSLRCFVPGELEALVCGDRTESWELPMLAECIQAAHGYDKSSLQYTLLLQYVAKLDRPMQKLFLKYVTGAPRLPFGGFARLSPNLTVAKRVTPEGDCPDMYLPSVMTCQNYLKMPEYSTGEILAQRFDYALKEGQNSFTLS